MDSQSENEDYFPSKPSENVLVKNDGSCITKNLTEVLVSSELSDVTIRCRQHLFHAHRLILHLSSSYFRDIFSSEEKGSDKPDIELDFDPDIIKLCIDFIYCKDVLISLAEAAKLGEVAEALGLETLSDQCLRSQWRNKKVTQDNCLEIWDLALRLEDEAFGEEAKFVALTSFSDLQFHSSFEKLSWECLRQYLSDKSLVTGNPYERIAAGLRWLRYKEERTKLAPEFVKSLPIHTMPDWVLKQALYDPIIQSSKEASDTVQKAYKLSLDSSHRPPLPPRRTKPEPTRSGYETVPPPKPIPKKRDSAKDPLEPIVPKPPLTNLTLGSFATPIEKVKCLVVGPSDSSKVNVGLIPCSPLKKSCSFSQLPTKFVQEPACCILGNFLYISGLGEDCDQAWRLNLHSNSWNELGRLKEPRTGHTMVACSSFVYVFGGRYPDEELYPIFLEDVEMICEGTKTFKTVGSMSILGTFEYVQGAAYGENDDIILYVSHENVSVFSTREDKITHSVNLSCGYSLGLGVYDGKAIIYGTLDIFAINLSELYKDKLEVLWKIPLYSGIRGRVVSLSDDSSYVFLLGGTREDNPEKRHLYLAKTAEVVHNVGEGWKRICQVPKGEYEIVKMK